MMRRNKSSIDKRKMAKVKRYRNMLRKKVKAKRKKWEVMNKLRVNLMTRKMIWRMKLDRMMMNRIFCKADRGMIKVKKKSQKILKSRINLQLSHTLIIVQMLQKSRTKNIKRDLNFTMK